MVQENEYMGINYDSMARTFLQEDMVTYTEQEVQDLANHLKEKLDLSEVNDQFWNLYLEY